MFGSPSARRSYILSDTSQRLISNATTSISTATLRPRQRLVIAILAAAAGILWSSAVLRLWRLLHGRYRRRFLCFSSPLLGATSKLALPPPPLGSWSWFPFQIEFPERWKGFCPSCKRPITASLSVEWWQKK